MRKYPGMRLPPGTDPLLRNELVKADRQLKLLSSALAKALTKTNLPTAVIGTGPPGSPPGHGLPDHDHSSTGFGGDVLGRTGFQMNAKGVWNLDDTITASTDKLRIKVDSPSQQALGIQLESGQTQKAIEILDSSGSEVFDVLSDGHVGVGIAGGILQGVDVFFENVPSVRGQGINVINNATETSGNESGGPQIGAIAGLVLNGNGDYSPQESIGIHSNVFYNGTNVSGPEIKGVVSDVYSMGTGPIAVAKAFDAKIIRNSTGSSVTNGYGYYYREDAGALGTLTNHRGFYSEQLNTGTNKHDFYGEGPQSYFKKIGVNITATGIAQCHIVNSTANGVGLALKMATSQSSNIFELRDSANTLINLIDNAGCLMTLVNGSGSPVFSDSTTSGKKLGVSLSGAGLGTSTLVVANSTLRAYTLADDSGTLVSRTASVDLTGQTATIGSTTMYTSPHTGIYRVSIYAKTTTAGSGGDTVTVTIGWNDGTAQTFTTATLDLATLNAYLQGTVVLYSNSAAITYATTVAAAGAPQYTLRLRVEAL